MAFFGGSSVDLTSPGPIGSTTPNTGAFTTLSANNGTITTNSPAITLAQTWNAAGTTFTSLRVNVTDTASNASSLLMDLQVGGTSRFKVDKNGSAYVRQGSYNNCGLVFGSNLDTGIYYASNFFYFDVGGAVGALVGSSGFLTPGGYYGLSAGGASSPDLILTRDAADILAQRRTTNAQTFRIYNTFTDASNYERGFMRWATNVLEIGAEAAGTGTSRNVSIVQGGATRLTIGSTIDANVSINCGQFIYNFQGLGARSLSADPTTSNLVSGFYNVFKNTTTGVVKLWYNDGGTMKSVTLA